MTMHDAPDAAGLVEAVREFLERDVMAATEGRVQFHARVAARVLAIVERELRFGGALEAAHGARLPSSASRPTRISPAPSGRAPSTTGTTR